jgi:hypothetical protein
VGSSTAGRTGYVAHVRKTTTVLLAALALTGLSACGGDGNGDSGGLDDALDAVSAGPSSEQYFAYSDVSRVREAAGTSDLTNETFRRWATPLSLGAPQLTQRRRPGGVDVFSADRYLTVGAGGDSASRADGLEGDTAALTEGIEDAAVENGTVAVATSPAALKEVLGQSETPLGERAGYATSAACLSDVVAAAVGPAPGGDYDLVAIGVRGGDDPVDVLCIVGDADQAKRAADALGQAEQLADAQVETGDSDGRSWARVLHTPAGTEPLGFFYRGVFQAMLLPRWLGSAG